VIIENLANLSEIFLISQITGIYACNTFFKNKFLRDSPRHLFIYLFSENNKICPVQKSMFQTIILFYFIFGTTFFSFFLFSSIKSLEFLVFLG